MWNIPDAVINNAEKLGLELESTGGGFDYVSKRFQLDVGHCPAIEVFVTQNGEPVEKISGPGELMFTYYHDDQDDGVSVLGQRFKDYASVKSAMRSLAKMTAKQAEAYLLKCQSKKDLERFEAYKLERAEDLVYAAEQAVGNAKQNLKRAERRLARLKQTQGR